MYRKVNTLPNKRFYEQIKGCAVPTSRITHRAKEETYSKWLLRPIKKPDLDNLIKGIKVGCNKIIWHDDSQIVDMTVRKFYSEQSRAEVMIEW
ncbi:RusA family crossover junction endodeoxyribonuclease [Lysinibacillus xylanilyticus]|uniref:RusA family crossover junction endodeoxyribonuclease n=1 Tax=Lysinibacillus xylanilyticus TaxID=582475 RepID=UPI003D07D276